MTEQLQIVKICSLSWCLRKKKLRQALTLKSYDALSIYVKTIKKLILSQNESEGLAGLHVILLRTLARTQPPMTEGTSVCTELLVRGDANKGKNMNI